MAFEIKGKERKLRIAMPKVLLLMGLVIPITIFAFTAGDPPVLDDEPLYTQGRTNTICWGPTDIADEPSITAYQVVVDTSESIPDTVSCCSDLSICPIPLSLIEDGHCFTVGTDGTGSPADDPLISGVRYCYRVRYRYDDSGTPTWSEWSNIVCSTQDNNPPVVAVESLWVWTNTPSVDIHFTATDDVCGYVSKAFLYYRESDSDDWTIYDSVDVSSPSPASGFITFNSGSVSGDTYYEFYLTSRDSVGNERIPSRVLHHAQTWTRFDTGLPISQIDTVAIDEYYTVASLEVPFTASDSYSGVDSVNLYYMYESGSPTFYAMIEYDGMASVADSFLFNATNDGRYRLYTEAVDSANNVESVVAEDVTFFIDRQEPSYTSVLPYDTTTGSHPGEVVSEPLWTNSDVIWVSPVGQTDPDRDGYNSGLDSVYIAQDRDFTSNLTAYPYDPSGNYLYSLADGDGEKMVYVELKDMAGNLSAVDSSIVMLNSEAPVITSVRLADYAPDPDAETDTTDELMVAVHIVPDGSHGSYYKMFLTQNITDIDAIPESGWQDFDADPTYTLTGDPESWLTLYVVLKDSAGNVSPEVHDSIYYNPASYYFVDVVSVVDIDGPDLTGTYTDSARVNITVRYGRDVDSVVVWDDAGAVVAAFSVPTIPAATEAETTMTYDMSPGDGVRWIYADGKSIISPYPTDPDSESIILDTYNPHLPSISVRDVSTGYDPSDTSEVADWGYTNDRTVQVIFNSPSDDRTGLYHLKIQCSSEELEEAYAPSIDFNLPSGDGSKNVFGFVQDSAGNWSDYSDTIITLDTYDPVYTSLVLKDQTSLSDEWTDEPTILVASSAEDGMMGNPAYVAFFEDPSLYPDGLSDIWQPYSTTLSYTFVNTSPGVKTLYAALKDRAGNISRLTSDNIILNTGITVDLVLYDLDRHSEEYTNENTIGVRLDVGGTPPAGYILSEHSIDDLTPDDSRWRAFPSDSTTTYTFVEDISEGTKTLYGWVLSESDIISPVNTETIILDRTAARLTDGFYIYDTTTVESFPNVFKAHMGWSNSPAVWAVIPTADDDLSGVDSLGFFGPVQDHLWQTVPFSAVDSGIAVAYHPADSIPLLLDDGTTTARRWVVGRAIDGAGNWGNPFDSISQITIYGGYDTEPPTLEIVNPLTGLPADSIGWAVSEHFPCEITDTPDMGHLWKVCFWVDEIPDSHLCVEYDSSWGDGSVYNVVFPMRGVLIPNTLYHLNAVAVDSAGNASLVDRVLYWAIPDTVMFAFKLVDPADTVDSEYTGDDSVLTVITIPGAPDSMRFAEDPDVLLGTEWQPFSRVGSYRFNTVNEMKTLYAQVKHSGAVSPIISANIILDTVDPSVSSVTAYDIDTNDPSWSNSRDVKIVITGASDPPPGVVAALKCAEDPDFTYNVQILPFSTDNPEVIYTVAATRFGDTTSTGPPGQEDARIIYAQVLDRAENPSSTVHTSIVVDTEELMVTNHPNPFNPDVGKTYIRIKASEPGVSATVSIYDMFGRLVWKSDVTLPAGSRSTDVAWDGHNGNGDVVANGGYICVVETGSRVEKRKIAVWKGE